MIAEGSQHPSRKAGREESSVFKPQELVRWAVNAVKLLIAFQELWIGYGSSTLTVAKVLLLALLAATSKNR